MKKDMLTIIRKEFARFFGDKRMIFTTVLMPGLTIYILYSVMGRGMAKEFGTDDTYVASAYVQNMPEGLSPVFRNLAVEWTEIPGAEADAAKQAVKDKKADGLVVFPADFEKAVAERIAAGSQTAAVRAADSKVPGVEVYYNSTESESAKLYQAIQSVLDTYEESQVNLFDVNKGEERYDLASEKDMAGQFFALLLPVLLMSFLFSGCIAVAPEAIAGEKERGTIATLLVTPMKRSALALGKIASLSVIALLAGFSSFLGTMLALPKMMAAQAPGMDAAVYEAKDYVLLMGVICTTVLLVVGTMSAISACARSVKEASTANSPLMMLMMGVSLSTMFGGEREKNLGIFLIPIYNSAQCMHGIFSFQYKPEQVAVTIVSNLTLALLLAFGLTKLFDSEKVMFSK